MHCRVDGGPAAVSDLHTTLLRCHIGVVCGLASAAVLILLTFNCEQECLKEGP